MSYCRRGWAWLGPEYASDVYVYADVAGDWVCDDCPRLGHHREPTAGAMAAHLRADQHDGFRVPNAAIDELEADERDGTIQGIPRSRAPAV